MNTDNRIEVLATIARREREDTKMEPFVENAKPEGRAHSLGFASA